MSATLQHVKTSHAFNILVMQVVLQPPHSLFMQLKLFLTSKAQILPCCDLVLVFVACIEPDFLRMHLTDLIKSDSSLDLL